MTSCQSIIDQDIMHVIKESYIVIKTPIDFINNNLFRNFKIETFTGQTSTLKIKIKKISKVI